MKVMLEVLLEEMHIRLGERLVETMLLVLFEEMHARGWGGGWIELEFAEIVACAGSV